MITVERNTLVEILQSTANVVDRKQTIPILANLLVDLVEDSIRVIGTDLEMTVESRASANVTEESRFTVDAKKMFDICKAFPEGTEIKIEVNDGSVNIRQGRSRYKLITMVADHFPKPEEIVFFQDFQVSEISLKKLIDQTLFCVAVQDVRYFLNGMLIELKGDSLRTVGSDGHRVAICESSGVIDIGDEEKISAIVPRKAVIEIQKLLKENEEIINCKLGKNHLRIELRNVIFTTKLVDAEYPNYLRFVPKDCFCELTVDKQEFSNKLQRSLILANEKLRGIVLEIFDNSLVIKAYNQKQEEATEEMEVEYEQQKVSFCYNGQYLMEAINKAGSEKVRLSFGSEFRSCLIEEVGMENCRFISMPMKL